MQYVFICVNISLSADEIIVVICAKEEKRPHEANLLQIIC